MLIEDVLCMLYTVLDVILFWSDTCRWSWEHALPNVFTNDQFADSVWPLSTRSPLHTVALATLLLYNKIVLHVLLPTACCSCGMLVLAAGSRCKGVGSMEPLGAGANLPYSPRFLGCMEPKLHSGPLDVTQPREPGLQGTLRLRPGAPSSKRKLERLRGHSQGCVLPRLSLLWMASEALKLPNLLPLVQPRLLSDSRVSA